MAILKLATIYNRLFNLYLASDHVTPATGKTPTVNLSKAGAAFGAAAGAVTEIGSGLYQVALTGADTNTTGDLAFSITATLCDTQQFVDQVSVRLVSDINMDSTGRINITGNLRQNQPCAAFPFAMTTSGIPKTGLAVTAQRSLGGAGFSPCANAPTELGNGIYVINLSAADLNAPTVILRFTASGADDNDIFLVTQP